MASTETLDCFLDRMVSDLVVRGTFLAKVTKIPAQQNIGLRVIGIFAEIMDEILGTVMQRTLTPYEAVSAPLVDAVFSGCESFVHVISAVLHLLGDARDVEKAIVTAQRVRREPEDQVTHRRRAADHRLADRQRE